MKGRPQRQARRPDMMAMMAQRISQVVTPRKSRVLWKRLLDSQIAQYGFDFGIANVPKWAEPLAEMQQRNGSIPAAEFLGKNIADMPQTTAMMQKQMENQFESRDAITARRAGISPLQVQAMPARPGQASARPVGMGGPSQSSMAASVNGGIDDSGYPVTLAGMLGRGILTTEQLQYASYNNVRSLISSFIGGSAAEQQKVTYLLQRWIIEGFVNGLDTKRAIGNTKFRINLVDPGCGSGGCADGTGYLQFYSGAYRGTDSAAIGIFYHEIGHDRFKLDHVGGGPYIMNSMFPTGVASNYNAMMNQYFTQAKNAGTGLTYTPSGGLGSTATDAWIKANPQAFPSITGVTMDPNAPPGVTGGPNNVVNTVNNIPAAPTISMTPISTGSGGDGSSGTSTPDDQDNTPVAGALPAMEQTQAFAAGLQDIMSRASPTLQGLGGALAAYKSG